MGRLFLIYLDEGRIYSCKSCHSHLAHSDELLSKGDYGEQIMGVYELFQTEDFHSRNGKAYLFNTVVNVTIGPLEERMMTSGLHTIADIFCNCCGRIVGWKYESAWEKNQKYKEGKFILERAKMVDGDGTDFFLDANQTSSDADDV